MANKDIFHVGGHDDAFTNRPCASHKHIKPATSDLPGSVHEERIPLSAKLKDPNFKTELERPIPSETKHPASEHPTLEKERKKTEHELDEEIWSLGWDRGQLLFALEAIREKMGNEGKETGIHWKREGELAGEFLYAKKPLGKEEKISLLEKMVLELKAELDEDYDKLIKKLDGRCCDLEERLKDLKIEGGYHGKQARQLRLEYQNPEKPLEKGIKPHLLERILDELKAEVYDDIEKLEERRDELRHSLWKSVRISGKHKNTAKELMSKLEDPNIAMKKQEELSLLNEIVQELEAELKERKSRPRFGKRVPSDQ